MNIPKIPAIPRRKCSQGSAFAPLLLRFCSVSRGDFVTLISNELPAQDTCDKVVGYPGAFPIGEAVYAHTSKYAVTAACGSVSYPFAATGSIGLQRKIHHASAVADGDDLALLLMPSVLPPAPGAIAYDDPALSAEAAAQIAATLYASVAF